jgi:branched-chain amino acid transport system ATP-binding protein
MLDHVLELFPVVHEWQYRDAALLSGGEQQMLAMGLASITDTKLTLLDEQNAKSALKLANYGYVLKTGKLLSKAKQLIFSRTKV